ncbi:DHH family phosphoesterase [Luteibaculum oceani]|uniref:Bifunctional oligoribonuclease/PAP phosphatase NrnA n=1 Tax=Luteibaculum oceani TaxID=1294296 RepID=A0A5C6UVL1_9FLAO|nr:bifunctional oligoribonuclease/PAP phosphatase NrnA [Luteibaculum oceani]TXC76166.1 bifunctional oligoribonuclease/PAP phosphatase NrnA [Luteibaculum oceani]
MELLRDKTELLLALKMHLKEVKNIAITTHINPDGDAIGSTMGLMLTLKSLGYNAKVITPNAMPAFLNWLDPNNEIINAEEQKDLFQTTIEQAELIFCLDFNTLKRIEHVGHAVEKTTCKKVLVDHHQQPEEFDYMFAFPGASSTCEIVFEMLKALEWKKYINSHAANSLYTGLMTDTGSFRYKGTTATTLRVASELVDLGADPAAINERVNNASSLNRLKLLGFSLNEKLEIISGKGVAFIYLSKEDLADFDYQPGDTEGLVNFPLGVDEIKVSVLIKEQDNKIKFSFRSKGDISVNDFARTYFDGGGHVNAAGGVSFDSWEATKTKFLNAVNEFF